MRRKCVLTYVVDEGHEIDFANPTARGHIDVPEVSNQGLVDDLQNQIKSLREARDAGYRTIDLLREAYRKLALELQRAEEQNNKLSEELACVNRVRVNCEEKLRKIDDIISPF